MVARRSLLLLIPLLVPASSQAVTYAHFKAYLVSNVCNIDDSEPITAGDPDLRFRMILSDIGAPACPSGCIADTDPATLDAVSQNQCGFHTTCGTWDFPDVETFKVIADGQGATFSFILIDDDTDADDNMGTHRFATDQTHYVTLEYNNNIPVSTATVCGEAVEGTGWPSNFTLHAVGWFTDTSGPLPVATPVAWDNGVPATIDDDSKLEFTWERAEDPNTGIASYVCALLDETTLSFVFNGIQPPLDTAMTVCASGCDFAYEPVSGRRYSFWVSAQNGKNPVIDNPMTATSPLVSIQMSGSVSVEDSPASLALSTPMPNPTDAGATLVYTLPTAGPARLEVVDLQGRRVALLADGIASAGPHRITWDGRDASGQKAKSGVYWIQLAVENARKLQRLVVVR